MSSLYKRTIILTACRMMNYFIMFISPMLLVRILDVQAYGQYREFLLYAAVLASFIGMAMPRSLLYFVARSPKNAAQYVTGTELLIIVTCTIGTGLILLSKGLILAHTSFNFIVLLILYIFFFLNLDFLDSYWLATKRSDYVLYYSVMRTLFRMVVAVGAAYYYRDVRMVIKAMIIFEIIKFAFCFCFLYTRGLFTCWLDGHIIKEQLIFIVPLGVASVIFYFNQQLSKLFIVNKMGVEALAIFAIGSTNVPIIGLVRSAISDVIFPEMAEKNVRDPLQGLRLWQKANIVYCFFVFPAFVVLFCYAGAVVQTLFTSKYLAAVPVFRVCLLLLLRQCFEMGSPIRAMNKNRYFIMGNVISLVLNIFLLFILFKYMGFIGPAIAFILADLALAIYMGYIIVKIYKVRLSNLFFWEKIFAVIGATVAGIPILLLSKFIDMNSIVRALVFSSLYVIIYYLFVRYYKIEEVELIIFNVLKKIRVSCKRAK